MPQDTPSRKLDQYIVRFPDGMRDLLKEAAEANNRSMNAEIVARLEDSFRGNINGEELTAALFGMATFARKGGMETLDELIAEIQRRMR